MTTLTCALVVAAATGLSVLSPAVASADTPRTQVPLLSNYKSCDFIQQDFVDATGYARGTAYLSTSGNTVSADVDFNTAVPDSFYDVRIIQTPRGSMGCGPGAPGVITGILRTDPGGAGHTTASGPIDANATGAWVIVSRPSAYSQTPVEFYTSEFITKI